MTYDAVADPPAERIGAGSRALSIFVYSAGAAVLRAHEDGPVRLYELVERSGWTAESSLRTAVERLCEAGVLTRCDGPGAKRHGTELTAAGRDLLPLADELERWLGDAVGGPVALDSDAGRAIVKAIVASWDASVLGAVARHPVSLAEIAASSPGTPYAVLKRRVAKLRSMQLIEQVSGGREPVYRAGEWLCRVARALVLAVRWELRHRAAGPEPDRAEVEAIFLLLAPLVKLPARASGNCALAVVCPDADGDGSELAGVLAAARRGRLSVHELRQDARPPVWALGTVEAWTRAAIDGELDGLRINDNPPALARAVIRGIHRALSR